MPSLKCDWLCAGNRIAFCNDLFSHLYGVKDDKCTDGRCQCTNDIVGDCSNFKLTKEYWEAKSKDKDATHYLQKNNDGTPRPFDERCHWPIAVYLV